MTPLRAKLWNPPNAVPDTGINLRNGAAELPADAPAIEWARRMKARIDG